MSTILTSPGRLSAAAPPSSAAWRFLGWFGLVLTAIGLGQVVLHLYPGSGFGSPEWEFGVAAQMLGALPLPTMGVAAMLAAAVALGNRRAVLGLAITLFLAGLAAIALLLMFWSVAPLALRGAPEIAAATIQQTVARSTLSGVGFGILYLGAAVVAARNLKR